LERPLYWPWLGAWSGERHQQQTAAAAAADAASGKHSSCSCSSTMRGSSSKSKYRRQGRCSSQGSQRGAGGREGAFDMTGAGQLITAVGAASGEGNPPRGTAGRVAKRALAGLVPFFD
jgi:hypothetical protein